MTKLGNRGKEEREKNTRGSEKKVGVGKKKKRLYQEGREGGGVRWKKLKEHEKEGKCVTKS